MTIGEYMKPDPEKLGGWLRVQRRRAGVTVRQVAEAVGTVPEAVYWWEQGRSLPALERIAALADALQLDDAGRLELVDRLSAEAAARRGAR